MNNHTVEVPPNALLLLLLLTATTTVTTTATKLVLHRFELLAVVMIVLDLYIS
jgi:hypothetical protein